MQNKKDVHHFLIFKIGRENLGMELILVREFMWRVDYSLICQTFVRRKSSGEYRVY